MSEQTETLLTEICAQAERDAQEAINAIRIHTLHKPMKPGDVVVLECPGKLRSQWHSEMNKFFKSEFPEQKCLVLEEGVRIATILRKEESK